MDRLQCRKVRKPSCRPHPASLKPPRGPIFRPPPASRSLPEPSSPGADGWHMKKVRFVDEVGSHRIGGRRVASIPEAARSKIQVCDAKTAEFKIFKKMCEQSGHISHSYKHSHINSELNTSRQKQEVHDVTPLRKVSAQRNTMYRDETVATPSKNEEIPSAQVNAQASHCEYEDKNQPHLHSDAHVPHIHIFTPIAKTSFEITETSRNNYREPVTGQVFSEKRSKLLKLAAKAMSMGCDELLQRRSEFVSGILQRLGANKIIRKQRERSTRNMKTECRQAPGSSEGHADRLLDYKQIEFKPLTTLKGPGQNSSLEFMALPCGYNQSLLGFMDWKKSLSHGGNEDHEPIALPWLRIEEIPSSDQNRGIVHDPVSNLLLKDVEPCILDRSASGNELSLNIENASYDHHGWSPILSVPFSESFQDRLSFPYHVEKHSIPHAISNTPWQPEPFSSMEQCISSSVGQDKEGSEEAGWCDNSDAVFSTSFDQSLVKRSASCLLGSENEVLDNNDFRYISNFHVRNRMVLSASTSHPSLICSTPEHPYNLHPMRFHGSATGISCLAGLNEKHSRGVGLSDNSDRLQRVLDQLPLLSTFPNKESSIWDHHHLRYITSYPTTDCSNTLLLDANDSDLNYMSACLEDPCKQDDSINFDGCSTEMWSSMHQLQSHTSFGAVLGLRSNECSYKDSGHHGLMVVQSNLNNDTLGATALSFFGSLSAMDNIKEAPMLSPDGTTW